MGAAHERVDTSRHPAMHKTKTIDYIILLSGDVTLLLDEDEVRLKPFNVVVQRGTNHAWVNNGKEPSLSSTVSYAIQTASLLIIAFVNGSLEAKWK